MNIRYEDHFSWYEKRWFKPSKSWFFIFRFYCGPARFSYSFSPPQGEVRLPLQGTAVVGVAWLVGVLSCKSKGHGFDSLSVHKPAMQVRSPVGACAGGSRSTFPSHISVSLPSLKSISMSIGEDKKCHRERKKQRTHKLKQINSCPA